VRHFLGLALAFACACASAQEAEPTSTSEPAPAERPGEHMALRLEARRRVSWGHGCGGNCAQNTRGESAVRLVAGGSSVTVGDEGTTTTTFSSPGSLDTRWRRWSISWKGTMIVDQQRMTLKLASSPGNCEEGQTLAKRATTSACRHLPPDTLVVVCARTAVPVENTADKPVWSCQPDPVIPADAWSGTAFPWVFGIDDPIDTVHAGEPEPRTRYQLRPN
jgi:hypothetical protein